MSVHHTFNDLDNRPDCVTPGQYPATIIKAEEKLSKQGNDMIALTWELNGNKLWVFDHIVFLPTSAWKVDTFLKAIGHAPEKGKEVEIKADELVGCKAILELEVEPAAGTYPAKNKVAKYLAPTSAPQEKQSDEPF